LWMSVVVPVDCTGPTFVFTSLVDDSMASDVASQRRRCGPGSGSVSAGSLSGEGRTASGAEARDRERSSGRGPLNDHHMII